MIDHLDNQTQPLPLDKVPGNIRNDTEVTGMAEMEPHGVVFAPCPTARKPRGRPGTGQALSNAERQRLYRERQKAQRNEKAEKPAVEKLREMARAEFKRAEGLQAQVIDMGLKIAQLKHEIRQLKQSASPSRLNQGMRKIIEDVHDVADALEGSTWRIQRKKGSKGKWSTLKGSYWQEARAQDALLDLPECKGATYRIIETKSEVED